jgi:type VI secretion system protein VasG
MTIVPFRPLDQTIMTDIVRMKLARVAERMFMTHGVRLDIDDRVAEQIADRCLEVETGARNIDHILDGSVLPLLSRELLSLMTLDDRPESLTLTLSSDGHIMLKDPSGVTQDVEPNG